ncbi:MAG: heparinase II/III family protein [Prolixibacteraceae bacterium]
MHTIKNLILLTVCLLLTISVQSKEKRNLLSDFYTRKFVNESITSDFSWIPYPAYQDRESWLKLPKEIRDKTIEQGEKFLKYEWPIVTLSTYLEFTRKGDRTTVDNLNGERAKALQSLVLAELMEGKGRFMDDIINGVFSFCEQTFWGSSAHFYMYGGAVSEPATTVPDLDNPIVDLFAGDRAADLSWVWYFFHEEFDKTSPVISKRLKNEIKRKVLEPFYARYDYWWITGWDEGKVNNWNPWCNFNVLTSILLIEDNPEKKEDAVYKTMESVDLFINSYPNDGACNEGPSYWGVAGGKMFDYLNLLKTNTRGRIDIFNHELIKNMGRYIARAYVSNGNYYINFADAPFRIGQDGGKIYRFGKSINDPMLAGFGAYLLEKSKFNENGMVGKIGETLENLFNLGGWESSQRTEPLLAEFYFPDLDVALARDKANSTEGFYFAAKGGNNGEGHNHNDVGSFILYFNGLPVLIDVGVGTYTRETFSSQRYNIWTMQSNYHNLPLINGHGQSPGGTFKAQHSSFSASTNKVSFSTDIALAYASGANVPKWERSYTLERGKRFTIKDDYRLTANSGDNSVHFMTSVPCQIIKPGLIRFTGENFTLSMKYNPSQLVADIEKIKIEDKRLQGVFGDYLSRLVFRLTANNLSDQLSFDVVPVK